MAALHVQSNSAGWFGGSGTTESTANFASATTTGNLVVAVVAWSTTTAVLNTPTDTAGNTFTLISSTADGANGKMAVYYAKSITGGAAYHVTATWDVDPGFGYIAAHEASGLDTTAPLDQQIAQAQGTPGTTADIITSTAKTTTGAGEYIFGASFDDFGDGASTLTAGTGFANRENPQVWARTESQIQSAAGSIAATFTDAGAGAVGHYITAMATFFAAGAGSTDRKPLLARFP